MPRTFDPAGMKRLMSAERRRETPPEKILAEIGVAAGQTVVDIGAGPGFFALPAARLVGPGGRVVGIDVSPVMIKALKGNARRAGLKNVRTILVGETPVKLPAGANVYLMANVLHDMEDKVAYLRLVRRGMTSPSRLAIVDFLRKPTVHGPPLGERIPLARIGSLLADAGFAVERSFRAGRDHYAVIARKA